MAIVLGFTWKVLWISTWIRLGICLDNLRLRIESSTFEPCPHIKNGRLISNNSRLDFSQGQYNLAKYGTASLSRLQVIDQRGRTKDLNLPGCFNVRVDATFTQNIENPYVEAFVKNERDEPCKKFKTNPYCPGTDNPMVRLQTQNQVTCKICDICVTSEELESKKKKGASEILIHAGGSACATNGRRIEAGQTYPFELTNICTPTSNEIDTELTKKFGPTWHEVDFIRRGTVIITVHVMERGHATPKPCLQLGAGTYQWTGPSTLETKVKENLENSCKRFRDPVREADKPKDEYLGCYNGYINYAIDRL